MSSVIVPSVVLPSVIIPSVVAPFAISLQRNGISAAFAYGECRVSLHRVSSYHLPFRFSEMAYPPHSPMANAFAIRFSEMAKPVANARIRQSVVIPSVIMLNVVAERV